MDQDIGSSLYILLLNTDIIFQNYAIIAQIMLSFPLSRLSSEGFKRLLSIRALFCTRRGY